MIDVTDDFVAPTYFFFTSSATFLGLMLHLPIRHALIGTEFTIFDPDSLTHFPSYAIPVPTSVIPSALFNKQGGYSTSLNHARRLRNTKGIIVNTFEELESYAMKSLLVSQESPLVYAVGPLLDLSSHAQSGSY
ncbi:UDP-glycosyltransferase 101 [Camellia lanceoleosa]|uniref:UDP-glycosyltransferase 101 n=1 Tax=Camellia lanceoleosa TaxID=1840588 RepID=A0ACC0IDE2_9ERIC|nr:UDP-glycosyltransferase 101 [Camellia lanceoleosa]